MTTLVHERLPPLKRRRFILGWGLGRGECWAGGVGGQVGLIYFFNGSKSNLETLGNIFLRGGGRVTIFLHESSSWVELRLYT